MDWPQITIICYLALTIAVHGSLHGKPIKHDFNIFGAMFRAIVWGLLLWAGGFWVLQ